MICHRGCSILRKGVEERLDRKVGMDWREVKEKLGYA
jgi:hypothetical protein